MISDSNKGENVIFI